MSKRGIVVLAHGSRLQEANEEVIELVSRFGANEGNGLYCGVAFLQGGNPGLPEAVATAVAQKCNPIYIVPFFLTSGVHIREDIPQMLDQARQTHPGVAMIQCRPLGCDPRLTSILWERVTENT